MADPCDAIEAMLARVAPVGTERVGLRDARGRVLAQEIRAERDSPAANVSAMDGYAVRAGALRTLIERDGEATCSIAFEVETGRTPGPMPGDAIVRVFTGGVVPDGADAVVPREMVQEMPEQVTLGESALTALKPGRNVRPRGENATAGQVLLRPGRVVTPAAMATLAANGYAELEVYKKVRVALAISGNEVFSVRQSQLDMAAVRDANGPALCALIESAGWCSLTDVTTLPDDADASIQALGSLAKENDVLITTGGVSMGDHDVVPDALLALGGEVIYHHLSMRPGKPNLGALLPGSVAVLALPGNPVSALVGTTILVAPVLRRRGGFVEEPGAGWAGVEPGPVPPRPLAFRQYIPATVAAQGGLRPLPHRGSGDVAAIGLADGVFEVPPGQEAFDESQRRWYPWRLSP
ncbi:MAG: molybdopterin molybdotransferase MoeA [Planctomycetota bacterium]